MTTPYDWATDDGFTPPPPPRNGSGPGSARPGSQPGPDGSTRGAARDHLYDVTGRADWERRGGAAGGRGDHGGRDDRDASTAGPGGDRHHQGDRLIHAVERIEFTSERDIYALAKAINHLGRELHLILGMRAEELQAVLGTYKGKWYTFGSSSRVKARLVAAHLKVSAEAAKALGVGALKMSHAFHRHFVLPEQEAKQARNGAKTKRSFTIGDA